MYRHVATRHPDAPPADQADPPPKPANAANAAALTEYKDAYTEWVVDHILLRQIPVHLLDVTKIQPLIEYLTTSILSHDKNLCVRKYSARSHYSYVYTGGAAAGAAAAWHIRMDAYLYPNVFASVCNRIHDVVHSQMATRVYRAHSAVFDKVKHFLNYLADGGVCNDADDADDVAKIYKNFIRFLPAFIYFQCEKAGLVE